MSNSAMNIDLIFFSRKIRQGTKKLTLICATLLQYQHQQAKQVKKIVRLAVVVFLEYVIKMSKKTHIINVLVSLS